MRKSPNLQTTSIRSSLWMNLIFPPQRILLRSHPLKPMPLFHRRPSQKSRTFPPPLPHHPLQQSLQCLHHRKTPADRVSGLSALQPLEPIEASDGSGAQPTVVPVPQSKAKAMDKVSKRRRDLLISTAHPTSGDEMPPPAVPLGPFLRPSAKSRSALRRNPSLPPNKNRGRSPERSRSHGRAAKQHSGLAKPTGAKLKQKNHQKRHSSISKTKRCKDERSELLGRVCSISSCIFGLDTYAWAHINKNTWGDSAHPSQKMHVTSSKC